MRRHGIGPLRTGLDRVRRRCGFDRNELRREVDRRQRKAALWLLALYLAVAPAAALVAGRLTHDHGIRAERDERASRHQVTATVLEPGRQTLASRKRTVVTWTEADGSRHTGSAVTWRGDGAKGERQRIWVDDDSGRPVVKPRDRSQTVLATGAAGIGALTGLAVPPLLVYGTVRRRCDRRRYREWDAAWSRLDTHSAS
jgi:hypothetical protein